jgi:hypothetical protein
VTDRKKPSAAFWTTVVVILLPLLYVLSFGPACWITSRTERGGALMPVIYRPITWRLSGPQPVRDAIHWYASIGAAPYWRWQNIYYDVWQIDKPDDWKWDRHSPDFEPQSTTLIGLLRR